MEKIQNFYWLDIFKTNIYKEEFFKNHPEKTLILVNFILFIVQICYLFEN
jgi:hypothetical protein